MTRGRIDQQVDKIKAGPIPGHVAVIMDGNGRWAGRRLLPRIEGHRAGGKAVRRCLEAAVTIGVEYLTLYTFSIENWQRPRKEVSDLMKMLEQNLIQEKEKLIEEGIRLRAIGDLSLLPAGILGTLVKIQEATSGGNTLNLVLALSYGGRQELDSAAGILRESILRGEVEPGEVDEDLFDGCLYTAGMPPVDLLIRTSGEHRLSNFLLWQSAGAYLCFTKTLWPDFNKGHFYRAVEEYQKFAVPLLPAGKGVPSL
jgi:undecaprenyl diphosphate synthase